MFPVLMDATTTTANSGASAVILIVALAVAVLTVAGIWAMFVKAGQPGWAAIIPIYNTIVLMRVAGRPWWWILLLLIPIVNIVILIIVYMDLAKAFGGGCLLALGFYILPFVMFPVIGFGSAQYRNPRGPTGYPGQPYPQQGYPGQAYPTQPSTGQEYPGPQNPPQYPPQQ